MRLRAPHHATLTNEPLVERGPRGIDASRLLHNPPLSAVLHAIQVRFTEKQQTIRPELPFLPFLVSTAPCTRPRGQARWPRAT